MTHIRGTSHRVGGNSQVYFILISIGDVVHAIKDRSGVSSIITHIRGIGHRVGDNSQVYFIPIGIGDTVRVIKIRVE